MRLLGSVIVVFAACFWCVAVSAQNETATPPATDAPVIPTDATNPVPPADAQRAPTDAADNDAPKADAPAKKPAASEPKPSAKPQPLTKPTAGNWWWGTGRRKTAVARVRVRPGDGQFVVNKKEMATFFPRERDQKDLLNVLEKTSTNGKLDVHVNVRGGGITGQAGAIVLGLGRALRLYDQTLEPILRDNNFLTRDPRKVERKKYGQPGARKRFQFSKR